MSSPACPKQCIRCICHFAIFFADTIIYDNSSKQSSSFPTRQLSKDPHPQSEAAMSLRKSYYLGFCVLLLVLVPAILCIRSRISTAATPITRIADSPESVALNYQLALIHEEYDLALRALSTSLVNLPKTADELRQDLQGQSLLPEWELQPCVYFESAEVSGVAASVILREQFYDPCTGIDVRNLTFGTIRTEMRLENGEWKIISADEHFAPCWSDGSKCE
jgi:hypothetical protein